MFLCDIGNTTYHFNLNGDDFKIALNSKKLPKIDKKIYFISVNQKATKRFKKYYKNSVDLSDFFTFKTKYKGIGIDRQIVCNYFKDAIIIDAGSAITVDIVKKGKHKGGFILPGIKSFKDIYPKISKKLKFNFKNEVNLDKIPLNTNDAINYAILNAILQPIYNVYKKYNLTLIFTGGDGKVLYDIVKYKNKKYKKNIIFNSMKKIIKGTKC